MKFNGLVSSVIAAGLLLGSAGLAAAADNPFVLYQEDHDPAYNGTAVTLAPVAAASEMQSAVVAGPASAAMDAMMDHSAVPGGNPFALYQEDHDPVTGTTPVAASHIATDADRAISQVSPDPFD